MSASPSRGVALLALVLFLPLLLVAACSPVGSADPPAPAPAPADALTAKEAAPAGTERLAPVCPAPVAWRLEEVDERFGLDRAEAKAAIAEAARLWNEAAGRTLLEHDPDDGFPVAFVWDGRHGAVQERLAGQGELDEARDALEEARREVDRLQRELQVDREAHNARVEALDRRRVALAERVAAWEEEGRPENAEARAIRQEREEINREVAAVNRDAEALAELAGRVTREVDRVNEMARDWNQLRDRVLGTAVEGQYSAFYREWGRTLGSRVISLSREVLVWQFDDMDHLLRVLAHEMGHVLGLEHVDDMDAVMYHRARSTRPGTRPAAGVQLHPGDVAALDAACGPAS